MRLINTDEVIKIIEFENKWLFDTKSNNADTDIAFSGMISKIKELSIVRAVPIPDNATNGEVIEALFTKDMWKATDEDIEWWNAPYEGSDKE